MKKILSLSVQAGWLFFFGMMMLRAGAQPVGWSAEVDSLVAASRDAVARNQPSEALMLVEAATLLATPYVEEDPSRFARCLFNHGRALDRLNRWEEAEQKYKSALTIQENSGFPFPEDLAWTLNNLAVLYTAKGQFEEAEPLYQRSLEIRQKVLGNQHRDYLWSLNNLGDHYYRKGNYRLSEKYHRLALEGRESALGRDHGDYFWSLNNLAVLYNRIGQYEQAEAYYQEAIAVRLAQVGDTHISWAVAQNNLANLYLKLNRFEDARQRFQSALAVMASKLGEQHDYVATVKNNLGHVYKGLKDWDRSDSLYRAAKDIWAESPGVEHPKYAQVVHNLGELYAASGKSDEALVQFEEALAVRRKSLGADHPDVANTCNQLALLHWKEGRMEEAGAQLKEAARIQKILLGDACRFLTEQEQVLYAARFLENLDQFYSFAARQEESSGEWVARCLDLSLFYKGMVLDASQRLRARALHDPETRPVFQAWRKVKTSLAQEYARPASQRKNVAELEEQAKQLEKELANLMPAHQARETGWQELQAVLKPGEALLDFIAYTEYDPDLTGQRKLVALTLRKEDPYPRWIPAGDAKELEAIVQVHQDRRADYVNDLYAWPDRGMIALGSARRSLSEWMHEVIQNAGLKDVHTVYFVPADHLHRINLPVIPLDEERVWNDSLRWVRLASARQLLPVEPWAFQGKNALVLGGIEYDHLVDSLKGKEGQLPTDNNSRSGWSFLRWTEKESAQIAGTLREGGFAVRSLSRHDASEEDFKSMDMAGQSSPRVLHIATHGYFFPDPYEQTGGPNPDLALAPVYQLSENPMIRSGLVLAGGNHAWRNGEPTDPGREDGILTAYEISQMNLSNTELVVLSACETGLGDIQGNEGVYGLQRAFKIAGAKYLIMSLWQVPDRETMEFMTTFYRNWLEEKLTIPEAFRKTQREMRDRFYNPYAWGAFVLLE